MNRIIGFAGRLQSGKTELAKICEEFGYKRIYFALPLKNLIATLLQCDIEEVNRLKNGNEDGSVIITISQENVEYISSVTNIEECIVSDMLKNMDFFNTRDMLQIIGTDLIRTYNPDWHVNKVLENIKDNEKYVFDDVRFENEKQAIEKLGGDIWFVVRPKIDNVSKHISENTLRWQDFENVIINKHSIEYLKTMFHIFMECGYDISKKKRDKFITHIKEDEELKNAFIKANNPMDALHGLLIDPDLFTYVPRYLKNILVNKVEKNHNSVLVLVNNNEWVDVINALEIEDLKFHI